MLAAERKGGSPRFGKLHFPVGLWINSPRRRLAKMSRRWPSAGSVRSTSSDTASRGSEPPELRPPSKAKASRHKRLSNLFHRSGAGGGGGSGSGSGSGSGARWLSDKKLEELVDPGGEALGRDRDGVGEGGGGSGSRDPSSAPRQLPGILKIFGGNISRGANYKSVLATARSTARELVWEALERYGLAPDDGTLREYVLCDVVGRPGGAGGGEGWLMEHLRPVGDSERPLVLQDVWKPKSGCSRRFEIRRRQDVERFFEADAGEGGGPSSQARRLQRNRSRAASGGPAPPKERSEPPSLRRSISDMNLSTRRRRDRKAVLSVAGGDPPPTATTPPPPPPPEPPSTDGAAAGRGEEEEEEEGGGHGASLEQLSQCLIQPPQHHPYFLLLQGYGKQDFVLYIMTRSQHIFGRRAPPERPPQGSPLSIDTFLNAPDILPRHCLVRAPPGVPATVRPYRGAPMTHNGVPLFRRAPLKPGDLLGLGEHFLLLYKDPRGGAPQEQSPPWLPALRCQGCSTGRSRREALRYRAEHEERLLREIVREPWGAGGVPQGMGVLAPAFLLGLCMEHAWGAFPPQHLPRLLMRIAGLVKEEVWEKIKEIGDRQPENDGDPAAQGPEVLGPDLRPLTLWLANATELLNLAQARVLELEKELELEGPCPELSGDLETCDEAMGILDEVIMSTFQQTVYYLTKRLYATLPALLEANPFAAPLEAGAGPEPLRVPDGVGPTLGVFQSALELSRGCRLHPDLVSQTFGYLFFFCNASLFNSLMERGGALFQWGRAVRLRTTLDLVLDSVAAMGLGDVASEFFQKLSAASNLLCTPRACLSKGLPEQGGNAVGYTGNAMGVNGSQWESMGVNMTWSRLRAEFPALSPAQLHHILSHYQLGGGQAPPPAWSPPPEERDQVTAGDIFESFSEHPPLLLPSRGFLLRVGGGSEEGGGGDKGGVPEDEEGGLLQALARLRRLLWALEQEELPANQRGLPREGAP